MISNLDLIRIQREGAMFMPDIVRVYPRTSSRSGSGGTTYSTAPAPSWTGAGRLTPMDATIEEFYGDRLGGKQGWTITLPEDVTVPTVPLSSILRVGSRSFEVLGGDRGRSYRMTRRWDCVELT